jgi:hypothetical protein
VYVIEDHANGDIFACLPDGILVDSAIERHEYAVG